MNEMKEMMKKILTGGVECPSLDDNQSEGAWRWLDNFCSHPKT
jgi:hypothetical protein